LADPTRTEAQAQAQAPAAGLSARRVTTARLAVHLALAVVAVVVVHGVVAAQVSPTGAEAYRLVAPEAGWPAIDGPLTRLLSALGLALGDGPLGWRLPVILLWAAVPLLVAGAAASLGGRPAAIRGAWLIAAMPLAHAWGIFLGPAVLLAAAFAGAGWLLIGLTRARARGDRAWPWGVGIGIVLVAAWVGVAGLSGPGLGHAAEILPPSRLPRLLLFLVAGLNPWVLAAVAALVYGVRRQARATGPIPGLLVLGAAGLLLFLAASIARAVDPLMAAAALPPLLIALAAWPRATEWTGVLALTGAVFSAAFLFVLVAGVPGLYGTDDPTARLHGWEAAGEEVAVWCGTVDGAAGPRVVAEAEVAARLRLLVPECAPVARLPAETWVRPGDPERLVLLVHAGGDEAVPDLPPGCSAGAHGAPVGPEGLGLVVRPSRCTAP
jgi:hypothetical protein